MMAGVAEVSLHRLVRFGLVTFAIGGCLAVPPAPGDTGCGDEDALALYLFETPAGDEGDEVRDHGVGPPLHLVIRDPEQVEWLEPGLAVVGETLITSRGDTRKLLNAALESGVLTVEAWVKPTEPAYDHTGPARIVTMSTGVRTRDRNFSIGQEPGSPTWNSISTRIRNPDDPTSRSLELSSAGELAIRERASHIVATITEEQVLLVVDGAPFSLPLGADFAAWPTFPLNLANEFSDDGGSERPFLGEYYRLAIYDREMAYEEIACRAQARPPGAD
jgi:hypothetical protein